MANNPTFVATPKSSVVQVSVANTNRDGSGTLGNLLNGGTNGSRIDDIIINATGTTTAGMIRFYFYDGTNTRLIHEEPVSAITPSATVPAFRRVLQNLGWVIQSGHQIRVSTEKAETLNVAMLRGGDF